MCTLRSSSHGRAGRPLHLPPLQRLDQPCHLPASSACHCRARRLVLLALARPQCHARVVLGVHRGDARYAAQAELLRACLRDVVVSPSLMCCKPAAR